MWPCHCWCNVIGHMTALSDHRAICHAHGECQRIPRPNNFTPATPFTSFHRSKPEVRLRGARSNLRLHHQPATVQVDRAEARRTQRTRARGSGSLARIPKGILYSRHSKLLRAPSWRVYWGALSCLNVLRSELSPSISRRVKWARSLRSRTSGCQWAEYQSGVGSDPRIR